MFFVWSVTDRVVFLLPSLNKDIREWCQETCTCIKMICFPVCWIHDGEENHFVKKTQRVVFLSPLVVFPSHLLDCMVTGNSNITNLAWPVECRLESQVDYVLCDKTAFHLELWYLRVIIVKLTCDYITRNIYCRL